MTPASHIHEWQNKIVGICEIKLRRKLSNKELNFIRCTDDTIVLEMLEDAVGDLSDIELKPYLNSEIHLDFGA
ncbi:hypothetical protein [Sapientia aquatica]|uniref:Uncharacterized protein n=1 Tax=Sapientia aquatica TaxID=1549640 RepID=A0A4R5VWI4_9BURK|nr:hypothetical protein [Sapientia aquatica]TDK63710.1 hypothetical protein E2I14_14140 [Sapientia aquatica]